MTHVGSCDGKSEELCWLLWSSVVVLKEKQIKCHHQNIQCGPPSKEGVITAIENDREN